MMTLPVSYSLGCKISWVRYKIRYVTYLGFRITVCLGRPVLRVNLVPSQKELQDQFERLVGELSDAASIGKVTPSSSMAAPKPATVPANFQDRIKQTMERMKSSEAEVDAAVADSEGDDFLAEMLKQMQGAAGEGEGDEDFSKMLLTMMEQLTSKEILYEPMRELADKYPAWLSKNEGKEPQEDIDRYREQYGVVKEIVAKFEEPTYRDENDKDRDYIIDRMQKVCHFPVFVNFVYA